MFLIDNLQEPIMGVEMEVNISGPDKNQVLPIIKDPRPNWSMVIGRYLVVCLLGLGRIVPFRV